MSQHSDVNEMQQVGRDARFADDEINLFDLVNDLNLQKRWFFGPFTVCLVLGLLYVSLVKPVYQVKSVIKGATEGDLIELNAPQLTGGQTEQNIEGEELKGKIFSMSVEAAYTQAKQALLSREYRRKFYQSKLEEIKGYGFYDESLTLAQNFNSFDEDFHIKLSNPKKDAENFVEVKFDSTNSEFATQFLNEYVAFSLATRLMAIETNLKNKLSMAIDQLEYQAGLIKGTYDANKNRRKLELSEALTIAKAIGQKNPIQQKGNMITGGGKLPDYMFGEKALKAELTVIDRRAETSKELPFGEGYFVAGLPALLFEIKSLKELNVDFTKVSLAKVDELATLPRNPIKPRKMLIMALAGVAGGFLGLMMALVVAAYKRYKQEREA